MRSLVILNADSGTLKTTDLDDYSRHVEEVFSAEGRAVETRIIEGAEVRDALETAFGEDRSEAVIVAGGDGTVSCAGAMAWKSGKPMGVIPAGTLNLFARSLGVPLEIHDAAQALARSEVVDGDIATANDHPFLLHYSVGFQPRMVQLREEREFASRLGKIGASISAAIDSIRRPPSFPVDLDIDGNDRRLRLSSLAVSNNPFGEGHMPYADDLLTGKLGVYYARPASNAANARMFIDIGLGTWRANPDIRFEEADRVTFEFPRTRRKAKAVVDGELIDLPPSVSFKIHPGELKLLRASA